MSSTKQQQMYAPSQWHLEGREQVKVDHRTVEHIVVRDEDYIWLALVNNEEVDNGLENARRIANAPELLEALLSIPLEHDHQYPHLTACWMCKAQAAINKAEGKE